MWECALKFFGLEPVVQTNPMMLSGCQTNLKMSGLMGWEVAFCTPNLHKTSMEDFLLQGVAGDSATLEVAAKAGSGELLTPAIERLDVIRAEKIFNSTELHNGVYWYCTAGTSIGFAWNDTVLIYDSHHDQDSPRRIELGVKWKRQFLCRTTFLSTQNKRVRENDSGPQQALMMNE